MSLLQLKGYHSEKLDNVRKDIYFILFYFIYLFCVGYCRISPLSARPNECFYLVVGFVRKISVISQSPGKHAFGPILHRYTIHTAQRTETPRTTIDKFELSLELHGRNDKMLDGHPAATGWGMHIHAPEIFSTNGVAAPR